ncbi:hypothetical protein IFM89_037797 [Coptis chinensis]|uniref:F-box domain-containing protein n=1 Tax=Coptis chinensis TaxID=261450 RepID=A0A835LPV9_9MAGN|nr:hypothetical protein IFM89_037797 [Coptis chinensis]
MRKKAKKSLKKERKVGWEDLPEDIMLMIFSKVERKCLFQTTYSVCRSWRSMSSLKLFCRRKGCLSLARLKDIGNDEGYQLMKLLKMLIEGLDDKFEHITRLDFPEHLYLSDDHLYYVAQRVRQGRLKTLCFPAGVDREGWAEVGATLTKLLEPTNPHQNTRPHIEGRVSNPLLVQTQNDQAAMEVTSGAKQTWETVRPTIRIRSNQMVLNASWWSSTVLCKSSRGVPDWRWVEQNLMDGGEIQFSRWNLEVGSIPNAVLLAKEANIKFFGVPLHLRNCGIAELLAKECGQMVKIDEESLNWCSSCIRVKVQVKEFGSDPRILNVEERGYVFPIWVVIELDGSEERPFPNGEEELYGEDDQNRIDEMAVSRIEGRQVDQRIPL